MVQIQSILWAIKSNVVKIESILWTIESMISRFGGVGQTAIYFFFFHADTAHVLARMRTYKKMRARESARRDCELCKRREKRVLLYRAPIG